MNNCEPSIRDLLENLPLHGGDVETASKYFSIAKENWLDLSTGMNPLSYPVCELPQAIFEELPYVSAEFCSAVTKYYGMPNWLAVNGSQSVIQSLPSVLNEKQLFPILLPDFGYKEHQKHWQKTNELAFYSSLNEKKAISSIHEALGRNNQQHVLVINPNNPTAAMISAEQLLAIAERLADGAHLVVDEAFMDFSPECSLLKHEIPENVVVMRSFGKFFGLAGLRLGFVFSSNKEILHSIDERLGLWQVNNPAQFIANKALADEKWIKDRQAKIVIMKQAMHKLFQPVLGEPINLKTASLFLTYQADAQNVLTVYKMLAESAVLSRVVLEGGQALLRIGLLDINNSAGSAQLKAALDKICAFNGCQQLEVSA